MQNECNENLMVGLSKKVGIIMAYDEEMYQDYRLDLAPQRVVIKNATDWEDRCNELSDYLENNADKLSAKEYHDLRAIADKLLNFTPELVQVEHN